MPSLVMLSHGFPRAFSSPSNPSSLNLLFQRWLFSAGGMWPSEAAVDTFVTLVLFYSVCSYLKLMGDTCNLVCRLGTEASAERR